MNFGLNPSKAFLSGCEEFLRASGFKFKGLLSGFVLFFLVPNVAFAAGKKAPEIPAPAWDITDGKRVIQLEPTEDIQIEMPDRTQHHFGEDFHASMSARLDQSGKYVVMDQSMTEMPAQRIQKRNRSQSIQIGYHWIGSVTPAAVVRTRMQALNFQTGSRGERMFYGFDDRFRTPFNDGSGKYSNEFPLIFNSNETNWFGHTFDQKGVEPFDSRSGLDLGDGFEINVLFAWLNVKYAKYHSELRFQLEIQSPLSSTPTTRAISVSGDGFFFDVAGSYQMYSAGISVARKDAMNQALTRAIQGSLDSIDRSLGDLPLLAKVDNVMPDGTVLLGTGVFSQIKPGVLYQGVERPDMVVQVDFSNECGSQATVVQGDIASLRSGLLMQEIHALPAKSKQIRMRMANAVTGVTTSSEAIELPSANIPQSPELSQWVPFVSWIVAFGKSLVEAIFLPYRIARYFLYNQAYHSEPDFGYSDSLRIQGEGWADQVGLNSVPDMIQVSPIVAIIDSGVDYNHPVIHDHLWLNPNPSMDSNDRQDRYGWDFISQDSRPFDDGYHGTQLASLVTAVAPYAQIMPIKIFNPWGITTSAAIYAAFQYAVDHGANLILCGWATAVDSEAIRSGVLYARDHGVIVVAGAGDLGALLSQNPYYPAAFGGDVDNVVSVTSVDREDRLVQSSDYPANYDSNQILIAAPGENLEVAEPRNHYTRTSSTGLSAALVAGAFARNLAALGSPSSGSYRDTIQLLLDEADVIPDLQNAVRGGLRLHLRR